MSAKLRSAHLLDGRAARQVAELFRAFSDASRVRMVSVLSRQEVNVSTLARSVGISESAVSHHLRSLRQMGLVNARREGKEVYYRVEDDHIISLFEEGVKHIQHG